MFNGVTGECRFDVVVEPVPPANYIDIDGESPRVVMMGECQTLSVSKLLLVYIIRVFDTFFGRDR